MKNKKLMKVISFVAILLMVVMTVMPVFADDLTDPGRFTPESSDATNKVDNVMNLVLGVVQVIAAGVAVIMLIVLAIKYISASPEGKADIKKSAVQYIVGAILLFGASGILGLVRTFALKITAE